MKVVLVCNSDTLGGAAVVTRRLMQALQNQGVEASMLVMKKFSDDPTVSLIGSSLGRKVRFIAERGYIFAHNGFDKANLFKVSVANTGYDITRHPTVKQADAVILSWVNQGMMSLTDVKRLALTGKRVLWIMHDMWCMTGICHHSLECKRYEQNCGHCPYVKGGAVGNDLSRHVWQRKMRLFSECPSVTMVAVSSWLADCARHSSLLSGHDLHVVPNAFPCDDFATDQPRDISLLPAGVDLSRQLIIMGAARLDDPIKNLPLAIDALNSLASRRPDIAERAQAVFYGNLRDESLKAKLRFPALFTGRLGNEAVINSLLSQGSVVISSSRYETLPGTLIEGMAAGCTVVTTGHGGQRDIVDHGVTGYIVDDDSEAIADAIAQALDAPFDRAAQRQVVIERFSAPAVARKVIELIANR